MIPELQESTTVGVFGPVASGKSFLLREWAKKMFRVGVFDPPAEWEGMETVSAEPKQFAKRIEEAHKNGDGYQIVYYPMNVEGGFRWCAEAMWQPEEPRWFIVEECSLVMSPQYTHPNMDVLLRFARKRLLGVICASQRIADVHKDLCSACRMSVLFYTNESNDLEAISKRYGEEAADRVSELRALDYDDVSGAVRATPQALIHWRAKKTFEVVDIG